MTVEQYFKSYEDYFWQWEEGTEVIAIPQGNTIAYKVFTIETLKRLLPIGIPPFGTLLLTIMATNPTASVDLKFLEESFDEKFFGQEDSEFRNIRYEAFDFLKKLVALPESYKTGGSRSELFFTLFTDSHNRISTKKATLLFKEYEKQEDHFDKRMLQSKEGLDIAVFYTEFRILELLNYKFKDTQAIIDNIIALPFIDQDFLDSVTESSTDQSDGAPQELDKWLEQLLTSTSTQTFHIAALIKNLWSGLNIPFKQLKPSEQPMGGISDITNKGSFDRLLISEFAHDDLSFLSRLANNEALYLHRESPPDDNYLERIILIDNSIKNWGTPRVVAYAIMLAIAKHPKAKTASTAYSLGNEIVPIKFEQPHEIVNSLRLLDRNIDCSKSLATFMDGDINNKKSELVFISTEEAVKSVAMQQLIQQNRQQINYFITTNSTGTINIYKHQNKGRKFIQTLQLSLEDLWKKQPKPQKERLVDPVNNCPILFPKPMQSKRMLSTDDGEVYLITKEKHFFRFYGSNEKYNQKGWELLYKRLPITSGNYEIGLTSEGEYVLLIFNVQDRSITIINFTSGQEYHKKFPQWTSSDRKEFLFHEDQFYYFVHYQYWVIDPNSNDSPVLIKGQSPVKLNTLYKERQKELKELRKTLSFAPNLLKNVHSISISLNGNLVLNSMHEFLMNPYGVIKLNNTNPKNGTQIASRVDNKQEFMFEDGSKIFINKSGMLTLVSSNTGLPVIYVPLVLDSALGIGTEEYFCGNDFYNPSDNGALAIMNTKKFWENFVQPFVDTIKGI